MSSIRARATVSFIGLTLGISLLACSTESSPTADGGNSTDSATTTNTTNTTNTANPDLGVDSAAPDSASADPCAPENLASETLAGGTKLLGGVTLPASTPLADIVADMDSYVGQTLRIEGFIVEICSEQGCYVTLQDLTGNAVNLKVFDGALDFRLKAQLGQYAVGEGAFTKVGEHGAQVDIMQGGAMIGSRKCGL